MKRQSPSHRIRFEVPSHGRLFDVGEQKCERLRNRHRDTGTGHLVEKLRTLLENRDLQITKLRSWLQAESLGEVLPGPLKRGQCLCLTA